MEGGQVLWVQRFRASALLCQRCAEERGKRGMEKEAKHNLNLRRFYMKYIYSVFLFLSVVFIRSFSLIHGGNICQQFAAGESHSLPNLFLGAKKAASGSNLRGLYDQKRMFSECLPVTYNPLQGPRAGGSCSVVLVKD